MPTFLLACKCGAPLKSLRKKYCSLRCTSKYDATDFEVNALKTLRFQATV